VPACIVVQNEWPIPEQVRSDFVHFSAQFLQPVAIIRCCHTCFTWNSICHDNSFVIISKDHHLLELWLRSSKFFVSRGVWTSPLVWLRFQLGSKVSNPRFVNSNNSMPSALNLCFSNVAIPKGFCFCSAVKQWGTHLAKMFLFCKPFDKIRNTDHDKIPVPSDVFFHVHLLQEIPPQVLHFFHLLMFSAFLALGHRLW
jgi:hypothetical protein